MIDVPSIEDIVVSGKRILVRADLEGDKDSPRFEATNFLVKYLKNNNASGIRVIGHEGEEWMGDMLGVDTDWNIRRDSREKENSNEFASELANGFDIYINESFASSHRMHTSIIALPKLMKQSGKQVGMGFRFKKELEMLSQVLDRQGKKLLVVGGTKVADKNKYAHELEPKFNGVLRGGLIEGAMRRADGLDIDDESIARFKVEIASAEVIVAAGVMGKYEEESASKGTREVLEAITNSKAYKVAGGGDIEAAISKYDLSSKFDWISVGGGAMLEYLAQGTLPGIQALVE